MNNIQLYNLIELEKEIQEQFQKLVPEIYAKAKQIFDFRKMGSSWCKFPKDYGRLENMQDHGSDSISINRQFITIYWSEYHCQEEDYYDISFSTDYLFMSDEEWQKIEIIEKKKREIEYKKQEKEKAFEEREKQRKADIKEYERLKVKLNK